MFTIALLTVAKLWNQPSCPANDVMVKQMWSMNNGVLLSHKEEQNYAVCKKVDGTRYHHFE
jgi:hypothetical protein